MATSRYLPIISTRRLQAHAWRRGLAGSPAWLSVGVAWAGFRVLRRVVAPSSTVLYRHRLQPGERWEITGTAGPSSRRKRRRAARGAS